MAITDYGLRVSKKGYDTKDCADKELIFSSSFQTLKVFNRYAVTALIPDEFTTNSITINHNLGYYAPFLIFYNGNSRTGVTKSVPWFTSASGNPDNSINTLTIYIQDYFTGTVEGDTVYFTVYVFLDDFETVEEEIINTTATSAGDDGNYGLRVSKDGYDVKNCTDDQLVMSSSFTPSIIDKKGTEVGSLVEVSHGLGYSPDFMVFYRENGGTTIKTLTQSYFWTLSQFYGSYCNINTTRLQIGKNHNGSSGWESNVTYYYIIFKNVVK